MAKSGTKIREFILENVEDHPKDITRHTAEEFGLTRQGVLRYVRSLIEEGLISVSGRTKGREYKLKPIHEEVFTIEIDDEVTEDEVWRDRVAPLLENQRENVVSICQYGFTEMFNNVLEHADASTAVVSVDVYPHKIEMIIHDDGVGIFNRIQTELGLDDKRHAILELSKGKLTTDPAGHTGEGIFFTSRMFDEYSIISSDLFFSHTEPQDDWLLQSEKSREGTTIFMTISTDAERTTTEVFDKFSVKGSYGFDRTHVPVSLSRYGEENLVSRSQARRLLARFDRFKEVFLDFKGVEEIGQAFADEIFRVFQNENPNVKIVYANADSRVKRMIWRAKGVSPHRPD